MRKQLLALACVVGLAGIIQFAGCQGSTTQSVSAPSTTLVVSGGDAPLCSIFSFSVTITGMTLTPQTVPIGSSGGGVVSVLAPGSSVSLDFASLLDFSTMLSLSSLPAGTYSTLTVTLANPHINYLDTSKSPPVIGTLTPTLSTLTVPITLNPALTVTGNGTAGLSLDFNLLQSVLTDPTTGQLTGKVTPTFTATPSTTPGANGFAEFEDLRGIVKAIATTSSNASFTGSLTVQPATGSALTIQVTSSTKFNGVSALGSLSAGTFVEVHAFADLNGNIVAKEIVAEGEEDAATGKAAFEGLITSVTYSAGKATQFNLYVGEEAPDVSSQVPLHSVLPVVVTSTTSFFITAQDANFTTFPFDATALGAGQRVVVQGQLNTGTSPLTANARSIYLGVQPVLGNLSTAGPVVFTGANNAAGGFFLAPCSPLFQPQPITVVTSTTTSFVGISSLSGLTSTTPFLVVKGLVLYEQTSGTFNGVVWSAPANLLVSEQVHQLQ